MVFARHRCRAGLRWTVDATLQNLDDSKVLLTSCIIETICKYENGERLLHMERVLSFFRCLSWSFSAACVLYYTLF